jgi:hypothetical protein
MKRLFMLRHSKGGSVVLKEDKTTMFFSTKPEAKVVRDMLGGTTVVTYGTDHKLYKGVK